MKRFSKSFIGLLAITSSVCTHFCSDFNLSRVVVFTPESTKNILYSQRSSLFNNNPDFKLYLIQVLGARLRYVSCEDANMAKDVGTVRVISRSKYSFRNGHDTKWFTICHTTFLAIVRQSWCSDWWHGFDNSHPSCSVSVSSAGPYVDTSCGTFLEGLAKIKEFYMGLKEASLSEAEIQDSINIEKGWTERYIPTKEIALTTYQLSMSIPGNIENQFPAPGVFFIKDNINFFNAETAGMFLDDWKSSPLEVLCVSSHESPQTDFLNAIHDLVNIIAAPIFDSPRHVGYTGFHFSSKTVIDCLCPGTPKTETSIPMITINIGMISPETLVAGSILAHNFNDLADGVMTYNSNWTIRGGCVILNVTIDDELSPGTIDNISRKDAILAAVNSVRSGCCQQSVLETNLAAGGSWEMHRTETPLEMSFEDAFRFTEPTQIMTNITNWLTETFEGEFAFGDLQDTNTAILADLTGEALKAFCAKVEMNILFSLGTYNSRYCFLNFIPTGV